VNPSTLEGKDTGFVFSRDGALLLVFLSLLNARRKTRTIVLALGVLGLLLSWANTIPSGIGFSTMCRSFDWAVPVQIQPRHGLLAGGLGLARIGGPDGRVGRERKEPEDPIGCRAHRTAAGVRFYRIRRVLFRASVVSPGYGSRAALARAGPLEEHAFDRRPVGSEPQMGGDLYSIAWAHPAGIEVHETPGPAGALVVLALCAEVLSQNLRLVP